LAVPRPWEGVCGRANYLAPAYYSQQAVFASPLSVFFISVMLCMEKVTSIDVSKVVHLPAAKQRIFNWNIQTLPFVVLPVNNWTFWWKLRDSVTHVCIILFLHFFWNTLYILLYA